METTRRVLDWFSPHSALAVTLVTLGVIVLMLGFFIQDIQLVPVDDEMEDDADYLADQTRQSAPSIRLGPGESYRTGPVAKGIRRTLPNRAAASADATELALSTDPAVSLPVKPAGRYSSNPVALPRVSPGYVALLSRTCDCRWAQDAKDPQEGSQFKVGQTLHLAAGLMEIVFGCGATAIVEGPAELELQSTKSSALRTGKLTAQVPDDVEGFTVHTPLVQVVSLCPLKTNGVAKLTCTADCQWAEGSAAIKEGACLLPGQAVKLAGGLAEITFACGAKVILQGPASFEIESAKTATLHTGRITADVPDDLEGFKIHTSAAEILSLPVEPKATAGKQAPPAAATTTKL